MLLNIQSGDGRHFHGFPGVSIRSSRGGDELNRHVRKLVVIAEPADVVRAELEVYPSFLDLEGVKLETVTVVMGEALFEIEPQYARDILARCDVVAAHRVVRELAERGVVLARRDR